MKWFLHPHFTELWFPKRYFALNGAETVGWLTLLLTAGELEISHLSGLSRLAAVVGDRRRRRSAASLPLPGSAASLGFGRQREEREGAQGGGGLARGAGGRGGLGWRAGHRLLTVVLLLTLVIGAVRTQTGLGDNSQ